MTFATPAVLTRMFCGEFVSRVQPARGVGQEAQRHARRKREPHLRRELAHLGERVAVDPLHHDVEDLLLFAEVEDLRDVRVLDARRDARLVEEHLLEARVAAELRSDGLHREELLEAPLAA
jgi:hypothetical protein